RIKLVLIRVFGHDDINMFRLLEVASRIGTNDRNRFVFTCKYGWIDMGHYFNNASITYMPYWLGLRHLTPAWVGRVFAWLGSYLTEAGQFWANSNSTYSPEDLISNYHGRELGEAMIEVGRVYDIPGHWEMFL